MVIGAALMIFSVVGVWIEAIRGGYLGVFFALGLIFFLMGKAGRHGDDRTARCPRCGAPRVIRMTQGEPWRAGVDFRNPEPRRGGKQYHCEACHDEW